MENSDKVSVGANMTVITPDRFIVEESPSHTAQEPDRTLWISEAGV